MICRTFTVQFKVNVDWHIAHRGNESRVAGFMVWLGGRLQGNTPACIPRKDPSPVGDVLGFYGTSIPVAAEFVNPAPSLIQHPP